MTNHLATLLPIPVNCLSAICNTHVAKCQGYPASKGDISACVTTSSSEIEKLAFSGALVPLARRSGIEAAMRAYDRGLSVSVLTS